ncbi:unnamed protein product, partial [Mesorhabditis spiculigera]
MSGRKVSFAALPFSGWRRKSSARRRESRRWREPASKALRASQVEMKSSSLPEDEMNTRAMQLLGDALDKDIGIENEIATWMKTQFEAKYVSKISVLLFRCDAG